MKLTHPQWAALSRIALEPEGSMPLRWIKGRMVHCYRVARSLEDKGLVTRTNAGKDSGDYLRITDAGRSALLEIPAQGEPEAIVGSDQYAEPNTASGSLTCPKCGSAHVTTVSGQGLRATCHDCGRIGGDHEFRADEHGTTICPICLCETTFRHDHQPDNSGLDDGPPLNEPRNRAEPKPADVMRDIRDRAWATRRAKYGERGHR